LTAIDQTAQIRGWAASEIDKICLGEDFPFCVLTQAASTPQGNVLGFLIVVQVRSPLLGGQPGLSMHPLPNPCPSEQAVRDTARAAVTELRGWVSAQLSVVNGQR